MKKIHWLVLGFYGVLSFLILNIIALHPTTHVPGPESDFYHFHWNFWWVRHALFDLKQSIYITDYIHVPFEQDLAFHTLTLVWFPFYLLFESLLGQILVVNIMIWLSLTFTGFLTYIFLRTEQLVKGSALLGGVILLASPYLIFHIWRFHLNLLALFWLPATALLWRQVILNQSWKWAIGLGIAFWAMWLTDTQWLLWNLFFILPYGMITLIKLHNRRHQGISILLGILAIVTMLILSWFIAPLRQMFDFDGVVQPVAAEDTQNLSAPLSVLWGKSGINDQSLGHILIPLVAVAILAPSQNHWRWIWLCIGLISFIIALGPTIEIANNTIDMPYRWIHRAFSGMYRAPARFIPVTLLALSLFVGLSLQSYLQQLRRPYRIILLSIVFIGVLGDGRIFRPIPSYAIPQYQFYDDISHDSSNTVVVEVPLGVANGWNVVGKFWTGEQFYGINHKKRMVNGFVARETTTNYLYFENSPLWNWLAGNINLNFDAAKAEIEPLITDWPIGYVVVHQDYFGVNDPRTLQWLQFFNSLDEFCLFAIEVDMVVYSTTAHPNGCTSTPMSSIQLGVDDIDKMGLGWYWAENFGGLSSRWMQNEASLYLNLPESFDSITITATTAFETSPHVEIWINTNHLGSIDVIEGWQTYTLDTENISIETDRRVELRLVADMVDSVGERELSIAVSSIIIE